MANTYKVLVTGSTGFVGKRLCAVLRENGFMVREGVRGSSATSAGPDVVVVRDIDKHTDWSQAISGIDTVIHLAGRAHVMHEQSSDPLSVYRQVNTEGTARLAMSAASAGVRRFIFVSTIKVHGESTSSKAFHENDIPNPIDPYAISKWEAEQVLWQIARQTNLEVIVIRPALVYGPGVKGNFLSLLRYVRSGLPLPLADCDNRRSFIGLTNLVDLLVRCVTHPNPGVETFLAADGEDLSTAELIRRMARALGRPARLLPIPARWLRFGARLVGRQAVYERLCGSLRVDSGKARRVLGWTPPLSVDEELANTARWFLGAKA